MIGGVERRDDRAAAGVGTDPIRVEPQAERFTRFTTVWRTTMPPVRVVNARWTSSPS